MAKVGTLLTRLYFIYVPNSRTNEIPANFLDKQFRKRCEVIMKKLKLNLVDFDLGSSYLINYYPIIFRINSLIWGPINANYRSKLLFFVIMIDIREDLGGLESNFFIHSDKWHFENDLYKYEDYLCYVVNVNIDKTYINRSHLFFSANWILEMNIYLQDNHSI